jgi:uncharacterized protein (DUF433 family)
MSNESLLSRITVDPEICHGKPCIRGLRYPVETILEYLAGGDTIEDLLKEFSDLEREDILACHEFARRMLTAKTIHLPLTLSFSWTRTCRRIFARYWRDTATMQTTRWTFRRKMLRRTSPLIGFRSTSNVLLFRKIQTSSAGALW